MVHLTYFEILISLAFYIFYQEKVDYAVIETGMGGLYDDTNTISNQNKLAILTRIGLDHTKILGNTIRGIAWQKAHIVQKGNSLISLWQSQPASQPARKIIEEIAKGKKAKIFLLKKDANFKNIRAGQEKTIFDFDFLDIKVNNIELSLLGPHQAENCSLALAAVWFLSKRDNFKFNLKKVKQALKQAYLPGRLEIIKLKGKTVIIDGAHNSQKMASLIKSLKILFPNKKFNFVIAFKRGKDYFSMLKDIVPLASKIIVARFFTASQDLIHLSEKPEEIGKALQQLDFKNYQIVGNSKKALKTASKFDQDLVITGSLYLISEIYSLVS